MNTHPLRLNVAKSAALFAAALSLAVLAGGCARTPSSPTAGGAGAQTQASLAQTAPARTPRPTPEPAGGDQSLPQPKRADDGAASFVNDFAEVIDARTEGLLEEKVGRLQARAGVELAVVTLGTTGGRDIADYSLALARGWGVGPPAGEPGGGLLLLLSVKDRKWHIQVSRGLEADLPNDVTGEIGRAMTPSLRAERYGEALTACVDGLIKRLAERRGFPAEGILQGATEGQPKEAQKPGRARPRRP